MNLNKIWWIIAFVTACSQEKIQLTKRQSSNLVDSEDNNSNSETENKKTKKTDPRSIKITSITLSDLRNQDGTLGQSLTFNLFGNPDWIGLKICPKSETQKECPPNRTCSEGGACIKDISMHQRIRLPPLYQGTVEIWLQPCIKAENSLTDTSCGPWVLKEYESQKADIEYLEVENKIALYSQAIDQTVINYQKDLRELIQKIKKCEMRNAAAESLLNTKLRFIDQFVSMPAKFVSDTIKQGINSTEATKEVGNHISSALSTAKNFLWEKCLTLGEDLNMRIKMSEMQEEGSLLLCEIGKGLKDMFNPAYSIGKMSEAIFDLFSDPDKLAGIQCNSEEKIALITAAYNSTIEISKKSLQKAITKAQSLNK